MKLSIPVATLKEFSSKYEELENYFNSWSRKDEIVTIDHSLLQPEIIKGFEEWLKTNQEADPAYMKCFKKWNSLMKVFREAETKVIKRLVDVPPAVLGFVEKNLPNHRLYKDSEGVLLPYRVMSTEYTPAKLPDHPASASIKLTATRHGKELSSNIYLHSEDLLEGKTVLEIFNGYQFVCETDELNADWLDSVEKYAILKKSIGDVYLGSGRCTKEIGDRYESSKPYYFKEDVSNKVVIDFNGYYSETDNKESTLKVIKYSQINSANVELPLHPYGHVFHLEEHCWLDVHVDNLEPYIFQGRELVKKLVLPKSDLEVIGILIEMSKMQLSDIVKGKSGGSFIVATGIPGTGKTLTAEVFSETIEKPLYKVQCSQLGINVETVEKRLQQVLRRASRWDAILLIDEADVYVRERGTDINQNAIVGTFLRVLEYYTGILFMTSNMETTIDDAIMSRATAHLIYKAPSISEQKAIWRILTDQFKASLSDRDIDDLVERFPGLVGRDIKALLKLAIMYSRNKQVPLTVGLFESIYAFVPNVRKNIEKE